jgi:ABC-type amino acid transport substrate-binding protein
MKSIAIVALVALVAVVSAEKDLSNVISVALGNYINNGPYVTVYQKYTPQSSPFYAPLDGNSCKRNLEALNLRNASTFTGGLRDVWNSGTIKWGIVDLDVDNNTYYGTNPERGWAYDFTSALTDEIGYILGKNIKSKVLTYSLSEEKGFLASALEVLDSGYIHAALDVTWLASRVSSVDFTCWYDSPALWNLYSTRNITIGDKEPQTLEDWAKNGGAGLKVAFPAGTVAQEVNNLFFPAADPVPVLNLPDALDAVQRGDADVTLSQAGTYEGWRFLNPNGTVAAVPNTNFRYGGGAAFILSKNN